MRATHRFLMMAAAAATAMTISAPAMAQTVAAPAPPQATGGRLYIGGIAGVGSAHEFGGLAGGEVGWRVSPRMDVLGEAAWVQNAINGSRLGAVNTLATFLQQSNGLSVASSIDAPTWTITGGIRRHFKDDGWRPYVTGLAGVARVTLRPTFTINGSDVTGNLGDYGVTLGEDLTGSSVKPAFGGGGGVSTTRGRLVIDVGVRVLSVQTDFRPTNILGVKVGVLYGF